MGSDVLSQELRASSRTRHLIFLAHLALCGPFLVIWMLDAHQRTKMNEAEFHHVALYISLGLAYLVVRAILAFRDPKWLRWEIVFPPLDVVIVSLLIWSGDRNPLDHTALLYLLPVTEAATTLSVGWSMAVAAMVAVGAAAATQGFQTDDPFATLFRYFFFFVVASLGAFLARSAAATREQLGVAHDRNRIAMEMHDGVQAHLVTIAAQLELASRLADRDPNRVAEIAKGGKESARLAADELRYLVHRLRSPALAEGFGSALKQFAHTICSRYQLDLSFTVEGEPDGMSPEVENALFRISQEALTNIVKHAGATKVEVILAYHPTDVLLSIADDGKGIREGADSGNGLASMAERAAKIGGTCGMKGRDPGTMVVVTAPLKSKGTWT